MPTIYIDPTVAGPGTGTFGDPYRTWASTGNLIAGNSYLQKEGTTFVGSIGPTGTGGTAAAPINIGVYAASDGSQITNKVGAAKVDATGLSFGMNITLARPYINVNGFEIFGALSANITKTAASNADPQYCTFRNLILRDSPQDGILVNGLGNKIINCQIYNNGQDGGRCVGNELEVAYCNMFNNGISDIDGDCFQLLNCNNPYIHHNVFNHKTSIYKQAFIHNRDDGLTSGGYIAYNTVLCADYIDPILFDIKTFYVGVPNVICVGNSIFGGMFGAYLIQDNITFQNNLVVTNSPLDIIGIAIRGLNQIVRNNTVVGNRPDTLSIGIDHQSTTHVGVIIQNNAILNYPVGIRTDVSGATYSYNAFNNCTVNNGDINRVAQAAGTGDVITSMQLDSAYVPTAISPLISVGLLTTNSQDLTSAGRFNPPCIGAYEYVRPRTVRI